MLSLPHDDAAHLRAHSRARALDEFGDYFAAYLRANPMLERELYDLGSAERRAGLWHAFRDVWLAARGLS